MKAIGDLQVSFPAASDNRAFLDGLIRVILDVTGRFYGVPTYQRILRAYAPSRRPSTTTILSVLVGVQGSFASLPAPGSEPVPSTATVPRAAAATPRQEEPTAVRLLAVELEEHRRQRRLLEADIARLEAAILEQSCELSRAQGEVGSAERALNAMADKLAELVNTVTHVTEAEKGGRAFALRAIEAARAESRLWRERYEGLQALRKEEQALLDSYRRAALGAAGAAR
ncbi:hypothetical protein OII53_11365 [Achromobacter ruhlandii]|jgi:hypothetical protein|uniref:hypothetical protein n=1 Tax=Achromobacter TaxID=222 RepID=UPI0020C64FEA|nr:MULTISPECIES: hypothetical protein [Achromobacter]MCV6796793.1 hypothetical protein [Achromobacter ruhlandii]MCV6800984.1 hypothetical protein [Achromobacter ruhlandii]MCV6809857.1 hypothetical protein [Achromobacter ruhlandii]MCV6819130.1 hypothetical protein [Achromobacter ruhlandii]